MADQDFQINIRTLADLTGIKLTQEQLTALQTAAKQGNIESIQALQKLKTAQDAATDSLKAQKEAETQISHGLRAAAGYGLLIGGVVAAGIERLAAAQNKVTKELDEQSRSLVKNVQEWNKLAQAAGSIEQLAGVGEKATAQIDQLAQKFNDANQETLTLSQTVQDLIFKFATWTPFGTGPNQAIIDERVKGLQKDLADAQENAARDVKRRLDEQRDAHENIDEIITRETTHLAEQQAILRTLDPGKDLQSWVAVEQTIERIQKRLEELQKQRQAQVAAGQPTTRAGLLAQQQAQLEQALVSPRLTPVEREAAYQQLVKTREERLQQEIRDRENAFQKEIYERQQRFTVPPDQRRPFQPTPTNIPAGESLTETNRLLSAILDLFR